MFTVLSLVLGICCWVSASKLKLYTWELINFGSCFSLFCYGALMLFYSLGRNIWNVITLTHTLTTNFWFWWLKNWRRKIRYTNLIEKRYFLLSTSVHLKWKVDFSLTSILQLIKCDLISFRSFNYLFLSILFLFRSLRTYTLNSNV